MAETQTASARKEDGSAQVLLFSRCWAVTENINIDSESSANVNEQFNHLFSEYLFIPMQTSKWNVPDVGSRISFLCI